MKKFKANDNKNEEHEINYRQFNKKLELLNQILSLISDINQASDEKEVKDCIPAGSMPVWHEKFLRGETIIIHDLEKIRETMPSEYDILKVQDA